jgi:hypothetical protein
MTDIDGLIERLRSLSRAEHDDISIGDEAATAPCPSANVTPL